MTSPAEPDNDPDTTTFYPVAAIEHVAQQVIRAAAHGDRQGMWDSYQAALVTIAEQSEDRMPWEDLSTVTRVSLGSARDALKAMLYAVTDPAEQKRLAKITAAEAEKAEKALETASPDGDVPGYRPRCAHCGNPIPAERGPLARYCSNSHRVTASRKRVAQKLTAGDRAGVNRHPSGAS